MAKMFRKGKIIDTIDELLECRTDGTPYVYWHDKLMHYSFLSSMPFRVVVSAIGIRVVRKAIKKQ